MIKAIRHIKFKEVLIVLLILGATFGYYLDLLIPEETTEFDLYFFKIESTFNMDAIDVLYYGKMKAFIIIFCVLWYVTCEYWWKSAILVPLVIEIFKLIGIINPNQRYFDEVEYFTSLPVTLPIIILLIFVLRKLYYYNIALDIRSEIDNKIDKVFFNLSGNKDKELENLKKKYNNVLKSKFSKQDKFLYLQNLLKIRDEFYKT